MSLQPVLLCVMLALFLLSCRSQVLPLSGSELLRLRWKNGIISCPGAELRSVPKRRALLVGISHYNRHLDHLQFADLHTENDLEGMIELLCNTYGFSALRVLQDQEATTAQIIGEFERFLIAESRAGDTAVFYYSGHGQRVADRPPLDEPDKYDEALVPYDYLTKDADNPQAKRILDDDLDRLLLALQGRVRPFGGSDGNITVILDACFAAGAVRSEGSLQPRGDGGSWRVESSDPAMESASGLLAPEDAQRRGYVVLSAARSDESAYEKDQRSVFTTSLLSELGREPRQTPRMLLGQITTGLRAQGYMQTPQAEGGAELDRMLFASHPGPRVIQVRSRGGDVFLQGGTLRQHVSEGAHFFLYPVGTDPFDPSERVAEVMVTKAGIMESHAQVNWTRGSNVDFGKTVAILSQHAPQDVVRVAARSHLLSAIRQQLDVVTGTEPDHADFIIEERNRELCLLSGPDRVAITCFLRGADEVQKVVELIDRHLVWRFLSRVELSAGIPVEMQLKVYRAAMDRDGYILPGRLGPELTKQRETQGGHLILKQPSDAEADVIQIQIRHDHPNPLYLNIFELYPDRRIKKIFPDPEARDSWRPLPRSKNWWDLGEASAPYFLRSISREQDGRLVHGHFQFKLIATLEPLYLSDLSWERKDYRRLTVSINATPWDRLNMYLGNDMRNRSQIQGIGTTLGTTVMRTFCVENCGR